MSGTTERHAGPEAGPGGSASSSTGPSPAAAEEARLQWTFPLWFGRFGAVGVLAGLFWFAGGAAGPPAWFMLAMLIVLLAAFIILTLQAQGQWMFYHHAAEAAKEDTR